jgi:hypothetical protein
LSQVDQCISILSKQKYHFLNTNREQEGRTGPVWGLGTTGSQEDMGRRCKRIHMLQILCNMYVNGKMISVETIQQWGDKGK